MIASIITGTAEYDVFDPGSRNLLGRRVPYAVAVVLNEGEEAPTWELASELFMDDRTVVSNWSDGTDEERIAELKQGIRDDGEREAALCGEDGNEEGQQKILAVIDMVRREDAGPN